MTKPTVYGQTHRMKWIFWVTLPIIATSTLLGLFLESKEAGVSIWNYNWISSDSLTGIIVTIISLILLWSIRLKWEFNNDQFEYHFIPFIWRNRSIPYSSIKEISFEKIRPLKDFGGWGFRSSHSKGRAYTTGGSQVIRIVTVDQKILNLTAQQHPEIENWIEYILKEKSIDL